MASVTEDHDNPEWTAADFATARPAGEPPADLLAAFPKTVDRSILPQGGEKDGGGRDLHETT